MEINYCEKYDVSKLDLEKPKKIEDVYVSSLNFTIQTPKLEISKVSKKLTLVLDENMEKLLKEFDTKIISLIHEKSKDFFEEEISLEDAEEIYKSSLKESKTDSRLSVSINKKLSIYNKRKEQLELESLEAGNIVICLLKCKKIVFYKNYCEPLWEVFQIKLKDHTIEIIDTKKYMFIDDENDNYVDKNDDEEIDDIKKINIKN